MLDVRQGIVHVIGPELGLSLLPRESDRLWTLNAVRVPDDVDEPSVRTHLLDEFNIEIGAGLGPLAGFGVSRRSTGAPPGPTT